MPLDFDTTKQFRDFVLSRTLQAPNGPQTFTAQNYRLQNLSQFPNIDPGEVDTNRQRDLSIPQTNNVFKPSEYFVKDTIDTIPRRANLSLYYNGTPYFINGQYNLVGIMSNDKYENESELFKFAASYIRDKNQKGPVYARIEQNLLKSTLGRIRLLDALQGNLATATNIVTGREPLVESNNSITVAKTPVGKGIDFIQTVAGLEFPWAEIPGDYLTNPNRQTERRNTANTEVGRTLQDASGALLSLLGVQRRPLETRKPSDLLIEYSGSGQKKQLFDLLSKSKYAPNYTTTARSQNTSKIFNFIEKAAQGVKEFLGVEAPEGVAYIGDDRGNNVLNSMSDMNGNIVRSNYYLSVMFDETQSKLFERIKGLSDGGEISGKLTWISRNSNNKLGENNKEYNGQSSNLTKSLSTQYEFREDSILGFTQELLDSMPKGGEARSHIGNVIDQTSRIFKEGEKFLSRGSSIKYVNKFSGVESGVEYCRTWTKDRPYLSYSDTMKKGGNNRKFDGTVVSDPWNLNIAPMSNGKKSFDDSSNIFQNYPFGTDKDNKSFYAKKYMFSIENLAWKTSNSPGFTVLDLPVCERGPNGGRVMWFPPYDLKISENNSAKWDENLFIGRPEPIYTYNNTSRNGTLSFKIVVDHPSILNLLTREFFSNMSDEEADNYINAFFAGCETLDFYDLIRRYSTLDPTDVDNILQYLNDSKNVEPDVAVSAISNVGQTTNINAPAIKTATELKEGSTTVGEPLKISLYFDNREPVGDPNDITSQKYSSLYSSYIAKKTEWKNNLQSDLTELNSVFTGDDLFKAKNDRNQIYGEGIIVDVSKITEQVNKLDGYFTEAEKNYTEYDTKITKLKETLESGKAQNIKIIIRSSTSSLDKLEYNQKLSSRRSYSILLDIFEKITKQGKTPPKIRWTDSSGNTSFDEDYSLRKDFGYDYDTVISVSIKNVGETATGNPTNALETNCVNRDFKKISRLGIISPISFYCRKSDVDVTYSVKSEKINPIVNQTTVTQQVVGPTSIRIDGVTQIPTKVKKPPIDIMKRIIMKTLSECYYFKKLDESSPVIFNSLREKLKYFHPGFHSTTPEGLNARLTFIHQCLRPGDTLPIKGVSDTNDLDARNTTFGPPPICILRVGDFYHSKVVIRDAQISYDDSTWDYNPEGIGLQPMIATVTLSISFLGGQGLEKPIERLQNALSSNYYANTEIYDERSIPTNTMIGGKDANTFTKEFLQDLQKRDNRTPVPDNSNTGNELRDGKYIGEKSSDGNSLTYSKLVIDVHEKIKNYFQVYSQSYNIIVPYYGKKISNLILSNTYRIIKTYDVWTSSDSVSTPSESFDLVGLYPQGKELFVYVQIVKRQFINTLKTSSPSTIFGFDKFMDATLINKTDNDYLYKYLETELSVIFDDLTNNSQILSIEESRDELIKSIDKVNFIVKHGKDFLINSDTSTNTTKGTEVTLSGFTKNLLYDEYVYGVNYIKENTTKFYEDLDSSIDFNNPTFTTNDLSDILKSLLKDKKAQIISIFTDKKIYNDSVINKMKKSLDKYFTNLIEPKKFTFKKYKEIVENKNLTFTIDTSNEVTSTDAIYVDGEKINKSPIIVKDKLNFYKLKL